MKSVFVIAIFCSLLIGFHASAQNKKGPNKLNVVLNKYDRSDDQTFHKNLDLDISSILKLGLLKVDYLNIVDVDQNSVNLFKTINDQKYIHHADIVISGTYSFTEKSIIIHSKIYITSEDKNFNLNPFSVSLNNPYMQFDILSNSLVENLESKWLEQSSGLKKIAILSRTSKAKKKSTLALNHFNELTTEIIKGMNKHPFIILTPWEKAQNFYLSELEYQEISDILNVDALLITKYELTDEGGIMLSPEFFIKNTEKSIELGEIRDDYFKDISFEEELIFRAKGFFDNIIKEDGSWNIDPFTLPGESFEDFFNIAIEFHEKARPSISNYYYFKAQDYNNKSSELHLNMGHNYIDLSRPKEAIQEFKVALLLDNKNRTAYSELFDVYTEAVDYDAALGVAKEALVGLAGDSLSFELAGLGYYYVKNYDSAIYYLNKSIEMTKDNSYMYAFLGLSQLAQYDNHSAVESFKKSLEKDPDNPDYQYYTAYGLSSISTELIDQEDYENALQNLLESQKYYELESTIYNTRLCYLMLGQLQDAENLFNKNIQNGYYSESYDYYQFASDIRYAIISRPDIDRKQYDEATLKYVKKHIEKNTDDGFGYWLAGNTYTSLGKIEEGLSYLEKAYKIDKKNSVFFLDLTESLLLNNKFEKSEEIYNEIFDEKDQYHLTINDKMILKLVHIGNVLALEEKFKSDEAKFIIKRIAEGNIIRGWSYDPFEAWVNQNLKEELRSDLIDLIKVMRENTK